MLVEATALATLLVFPVPTAYLCMSVMTGGLAIVTLGMYKMCHVLLGASR